MQIIVSNNSKNLVYANMVESENQILAKDTIIKRYRNHNGKMQYRRWNDTKKRWIDPKWIDMS